MAEKAEILKHLSTKDFKLVQLSESNKRYLLEKSIPSNDQHARAEKILSNLARLNPNLRNKFTVKAQPAIPNAPLKLFFSPQAEIVQNTSARVESYICISYCWHSDEWKKAGKEKDLEPWPFERTFVDSILRLTAVNEGIWFDKKCIDQDDPQEKKILIPAMDLIYGSARQVIIMLEDVVVTKDEGEFVEKYWQMYGVDYRKDQQDQADQADQANQDKKGMRFPGQKGWNLSNVPEEYIRNARTLFPKVMNARWFGRAWCSHEFRVSRYYTIDLQNAPRFRVMSESGQAVGIPAVLMLHFLHFLDQSMANEWMAKFLTLTTPSPIQILRLEPGLDPDVTGEHSLIQQIDVTLRMGCSRPDDRIQVTLNVAGLPLVWNGAVKSDCTETCHCRDETYQCQNETCHCKDKICRCKDEMCDCKLNTYWIFTQLAIADGDASVLGFMGPSLRVPGRKTPSWARHSPAPFIDSRLDLSRQDLGISALTPEYLDIDLLFLEKPAQRPSILAQGVAHTILQSNGLYDRDLHLRDGERQARRESAHYGHTHNHVFVRDVLACFVDGGISWMKSAWSVFEKELLPESQNKDTLASGPFWSGFDGTFDDGPGSSFSAAAREILAFHGDHSTAAQFKEDVEPIMKLLALITDPRFREFSQVPMLVQTSRDPDYAFLPSVIVGQKLAVPAALASQDCFVRRCWVLEAKDGLEGPAWKIVNKHYLLGCKDLVADGAVVVRRNTQRVYGSER